MTSTTPKSEQTAIDGVGRHAGLRLCVEATGRLLHLVLVYVAQRVLGPVLYGHFTWALAAGFVLSAVTSLGVPVIVTREVARNPADAARVTGAGLALKLVLTAAVTIVLGLVAAARPDGVRLATFVLGLAAIATSFVEFIGHALRGLHRLHHETWLLLLLRVLALVFGGAALWAGAGLLPFAVAYFLSAASTLAIAWTWLVSRFFTPQLRLDRFARDRVLRASMPLGAATVLSVVYSRTAVFVLDAVRGPAAVGVYGVARKLTEPLALVPAAVMAAVFPVISREGTAAAGERRRVLTLSLRGLAFVGGGIAVGGVVVGPTLVRVLYAGEYDDAARPLQILALAVLPVFVNYVLTHVLIAADRQQLNLAFNAVVFGVNAGLCLVLAASFDAPGAAGATLVSEIVLLGLCWAAVGRAGIGAPTAAAGTRGTRS